MKKALQQFNLSNILLSSWHPYAWIVVFGLLLFGRTLTFGLTYLDDQIWVLEYQWLFKDWTNAFHFFVRPDLVTNFFYRPLLHLSFMIDSNISGSSTIGFHVVNIALHLINSCLVFLLFTRLKYSRSLSLSFTLLFSSHPLMTMAVGWIPGRTDTLLAFFVFLCFLSFIFFLEKRNRIWLWVHVGLFLCALFVKETAVIVPAVMGAYIFLIRRKEASLKDIKWISLGWLGVLSIWFALRVIALSQPYSPKIPLAAITSSMQENAPALLVFIGKVFFPFKLSVVAILKDSLVWPGVLGLMILAVLVGVSPRKRISHLAFGALWFILFFLPTLVVSLVMHEYRIYIPLFGFIIVLMETKPIQWLDIKKKRLVIFTLITVSAFSFLTFRYTSKIKDRLTFWQNAVKMSPHLGLAHGNLGVVYQMKGALEAAKAEYFQAIKVNPHEIKAHNNLALIYRREGHYDKAEEEFLKEIAINPHYDDVYYNYALLCYSQGKVEKARTLLEKTLEINSNYLEAYRVLAIDYYEKGDIRKAYFYRQELLKRGVDINFISYRGF